MVKLLVILFALNSLSALASSDKVVYGDDNRLDPKDVTNAALKKLALSTAAMIQLTDIHTQGKNCTLGFDQTLETRMNVCPSERFSQQPVGALCSGFLVGPDTLVTAGHCFKLLGPMGFPNPAAVCKGFGWVFNYAVDRPGRNPLTGLTTDDVYRCKSVVTAQLTGTEDFTVIKLDRSVVGRAPLKFRTTGKVPDNANLVVIGHPSGLPTKIAPGARVLNNSASNRFVANLDTFQGNSGSAVFDANTGLLEGILIQGKTDYRPNQLNNPNSCQVVNTCDNSAGHCAFAPAGDTPGEVVTRITQLTRYLSAR